MSEQFVVDNSVVMAWCFEDESSQYSDAVLERLDLSEAIVPSIWPLEVGNVLLVAERRKRLTGADSVRFLTLLNQLPILVDQESPGRMMKEILAVAREYHISTYDASYLDLAMRMGISIATQDSGLLKAAKQSHVHVFKN